MENDVQLNIKSFDNKSLQTNLKGFYFNYKNNSYFISCNHHFAIKSIIVNNKEKKRFTNCLWNEILFCKSSIKKDQFVFKNFLVKQIDSKTNYKTINSSMNFVRNEYLPSGMIPGNNLNLYYVMNLNNGKIKKGDSGTPVYCKSNGNIKLIGIVSKTSDNLVYVIPIIYLIKSLNRKDNNNIYTINNIDNLSYLNNYKIYSNNNIYENSINNYIPISCYINLHSDICKKIIVKNKSLRETKINFCKLESNIINSFDYKVENNTIYLTSSLLRLLKEINERVVVKNFINILSKTEFEICINKKIYTVKF